MRMSKIAVALVVVGVAVWAPFARAQAVGFGPSFEVPRFDVSGGYNYIKANAPPSGCECFGMNGAYVSANYNLKNWLGVTGQFTYGHASDISALGQNLTLTTYLFGPKIQIQRNRIVPFGQVLFGEAHGSDSYFPTGTTYTTSAGGFAWSAGGGVDINLTQRFAVRVPEVQYLRTSFPNNASNEQNQLMISAGLVVKFGSRSHWTEAVKAPPPPSEIDFTCGGNVANIEQGGVIEIMGEAQTKPDQMRVIYSWATNGGKVTGGGRRVTIDTTGMPPGDYQVTGTASLASSPSTNQTCEVSFRVSAPRPAPQNDVVMMTPPPPPTSESDKRKDREFHENVADALFDYDSATLRPDAQEAVEHAAAYLKAHGNINVIIAGYADERGSAEYNLALGEQRANAARQALIHEGIAAERLRVVSYGKETQVCKTEDEACWQQNRRAAFALSR